MKNTGIKSKVISRAKLFACTSHRNVSRRVICITNSSSENEFHHNTTFENGEMHSKYANGTSIHLICPVMLFITNSTYLLSCPKRV